MAFNDVCHCAFFPQQGSTGLTLNLNVYFLGVPPEPSSVSQTVERIFVKQFSRRRLKDPATLRERRARTHASTRRSRRDLVRFTERNPARINAVRVTPLRASSRDQSERGLGTMETHGFRSRFRQAALFRTTSVTCPSQPCTQQTREYFAWRSLASGHVERAREPGFH